MGIYSEYIDKRFSFPALMEERKNQLKRISDLRERDVLVFASAISKQTAPISIQYADILPINDQLANLKGERLDLILESPGGAGEIAEEIIRIIRSKYNDVAVIVPGCAKSAATLMAMAADEILMGPASSLGPIDAQLTAPGKVFSAHALLEGFEKIKSEVEESGKINKAYIPILQGISPGELQHAKNALDFTKILVTDWLVKYKFKAWTVHSSTGAAVTDEERKARANTIANDLCNHGKWLTHGRSIKIDDLEAMRLQIFHFDDDPNLNDAILRYHTLMQMTFDSPIYKIYETPSSQILRMMAIAQPVPAKSGKLP